MKFNILNDNADIIESIIEDDFVKELISGSLDKQKFDYYISQDIHYLYAFAKAASICASKADNRDLEFFIEIQRAATFEVQNTNNFYANSKDFILTEGKTRANLHYSNYIIDMAYSKPIAVALSSIYPCPWLYMHIGQLFGRSVDINHRYHHWLTSNASPELPKFIAQFDDLLNRYAEENPQYIPDMKSAMRDGLIHEFYFWNDAYKLSKFEL